MEKVRKLGTFLTSQWQSVPFGSKLCVLISLTLYGIDLILSDFLFNLLKDIPSEVLQGNVYRLVFQEFFHGYLYNLLVSLITFYFSALEFEKQIGTVAFLIDVIIKNIIMQIIFIGMCSALSLISPYFLEQSSFGLWNVTMVYLTNKALLNPDEDVTFNCLPFSVKAKYCPFIIVIFLNIMEFPRLDLPAAILLGYLEYRYFNGVLLRPSDSNLQKLEDSFLFKNYQSRQDFITCDHNQHQFVADGFIQGKHLTLEIAQSSQFQSEKGTDDDLEGQNNLKQTMLVNEDIDEVSQQ